MNGGTLRRELGLGGAVVVGLGSILGTGAFVSIGLASASWGDAVLYAIPIAALVALCSGLSSAHLAGRFPVAGGTYEYAYETLGPWVGFEAGWLFVIAKTASAAAAALGVAEYINAGDPRLIAIAVVAAVTALVASGLRRTTLVNLVLLAVTLTGLLVFISSGIEAPVLGLVPPIDGEVTDILPAVAFLFVAYTGYGRIATLGEEVRNPEGTIPRAVVITLVVATVLYLGVELAGRAIYGPRWGMTVDTGMSPAELIPAPLSTVVALGAMTAMTGVVLNLLLGMSRVWLAMGRRGDMPKALARLSHGGQPVVAVLLSGLLVVVVCLLGDIRLAWSFSAFSVLLYYGVTNLSALQVDRHRITAWVGLISCLLLSFHVPPPVWLVGIGLVLLGVVWKWQRRY